MKEVNAILRAPKLRLEVANSGDSITITEADSEPRTFPCKVNAAQASQHRDVLRESLVKVKNLLKSARLQKRDLGIEDADRALNELFTSGAALTWQIFDDCSQEVSGVFQQAFSSWKTADEPVVITIVAKLNQTIPLEFLPLFDLTEWETCRDLLKLETAARRFPGFSAIVHREFLDLEPTHDLVLQNQPKLPLKCFVEDRLLGARAEVAFFKANKEHIDIDDGPWPTAFLSNFAKELFRHLRNENRTFSGAARVPSDQIQHFTCHCIINKDVPGESYLKLSEKNKVSINQLQARMPIARRRPKGQFGPLVFLNACGTSSIDPMAVTSFPHFFLSDVGSRGFIGTEANVPDLFAAEFSQSFYRGLLKGLTLGRAIHEAKWAMIRFNKNPLGILYTLYAHPDLQVSNRVGEVR